VIQYNAGILLQSGLSDLASHWGYVILTAVNFLMTSIGTILVDRKGRKFLLVLGTSGIIVSMVSVGLLFRTTEKLGVDCRESVQSIVGSNDQLKLHFDAAEASRMLAFAGYAGDAIHSDRATLTVIYSYGDFTAVSNSVRSDDAASAPIEITRDDAVPANRVESIFKNPFANLDAARTAPLKIEKAIIGTIPDARHGWLVALGLYMFIAFYAMGPGVCVWLALSELMPTRIRSNGMSIALVLNQSVSTILAGIFLPFVSKHNYSSMFFLFAAFTVVYFITAALFLPETKGKTLEEIEALFEGKAASSS
jgi:MFS family permease